MTSYRPTNRWRASSMAAALLLTLVGLPAVAGAHPVQDAGSDSSAAPGANMDAMMQAMMLAQPGPEHAELAKLAGEWDMELAIQMVPGMPAEKQTISASSKMILDGRFLETTTSGEFMGMSVETQGYLGFDRRVEQYNAMGMDTLGTYWVTARGQRDADGIIRLHGEDDSPMGKQIFTFEYEIVSPDEYEQRTLFTQMGQQAFDPPFLMVTAHCKRKPVGAPSGKADNNAPAAPDAERVARGEPLAADIVETACGQCQFDLPGDSCDLAVRVGDVAWFVTGTGIDEHGDSHASDGFCNAVRHARVSGHVKDDRFVATEFELLPEAEG